MTKPDAPRALPLLLPRNRIYIAHFYSVTGRSSRHFQQVLPFLLNSLKRHYRYYPHGHRIGSSPWRECAGFF